MRLSKNGRSRLAVTRLTLADPIGYDRTEPSQPDEAYSLTYKLAPIERLELWDDGRPTQDCGIAAETAKMIDLSQPSQSRITGPFDSVHVYIAKSALDDLAAETGARVSDSLAMPSNEADPLLGQLCRLVMAAPPELETANPLFAEQIGLGILTYVAERCGGLRLPKTPASESGLAPWQERRALEIMQARLAAPITIADIARECRLSPSHFAKAFRRSTGLSPHEQLTRLRIEEAKTHLLGSALPLADIALICGFGDQSYFTRVFTRTVGTSPGAWRRAVRS
ncbi:hypothetical protein ASG54_11780 [Aureimonas sp. Leaf460]|nr:hypothetical protein ASG62_14630 [Aureimonas sp. Leaf427]KQT77692.1 hypothetical protein ASG54_11780 [Aureimonas sp. Leaf460]